MPDQNSSDTHKIRAGREPIAAAAGSKLVETPIGPGLHVVSTPIGNLADITLRALATLADADLILCEDTRVTSRLKSAFALSAPLLAYHDHNARRVLPQIMETLEQGKIVALVSDAGTPVISDPGYRLIRTAGEAGITVVPVPGPSAALAALAGSALPTDRFLFAGFLPPKSGARRTALETLSAVPASLVFFESAKRLAVTLTDMATCLGEREAVIARELTKRHEEWRRGSLSDLADAIAREEPPRGEIVIVIGPPGESPALSDDEIDTRLVEALKSMSVRDAATAIAEETGQKRRALYARAITLQGGEDGEAG